MTLIRSISGIRGTIGGKPGEGLTPPDIVRFTAGFAKWLLRNNRKKIQVVIGRDARTSGGMISDLVSGTLLGMGIDVLDIGLTTTPTAGIAIPGSDSQGGIMITASHNPRQWNALKLLNEAGEFLSREEGETVLDIGTSGSSLCSNTGARNLFLRGPVPPDPY